MNINDNFEFLNVGLPEDILRRKTWGDFEGAVRLIDKRLAGNIPEALRACLVCEREMILRLEKDYPFSETQALEKIRAAIPEFTEAEFHAMVDDNKIDWIYVHGEPHYFLRFYQTLIKTDAAFAARAGVVNRGRVDGEDNGQTRESLLDRSARLMRENGKLANRIRIRASVRIKDEAFEKGKLVRVHIPIPAACIQQSEIELVGYYGTPKHIAAEDAPQRTIYWEEVMEENHEFWVEYSYLHTAPYVDPMKIVPDAEQPTFFTNEENPHIVFTPYIKELVKTLTRGVTNPVEKARIFYDFVTLNVKYSALKTSRKIVRATSRAIAACRPCCSSPSAAARVSRRAGRAAFALNPTMLVCMTGPCSMLRPMAGCSQILLTAAVRTGRAMSALFRQPRPLPHGGQLRIPCAVRSAESALAARPIRQPGGRNRIRRSRAARPRI